MSEAEVRKEALELLARGKIGIDEAIELMEQARGFSTSKEGDEPIYKAEMPEDSETDLINDIKIDDLLEPKAGFPAEKHKLQIEENEPTEVRVNGKLPRWLRIRVGELEGGKNKVAVNIPFGMLKFGLGIARVFSPEIKGIDLDVINDMFWQAETGLLVDVQDEESNEHVQIYFE